MLRLSKFPFKTLKTAPAVSDNRSTGLLLQAGYVRQEMAGAFVFLHLGTRVIEKIKTVIRQELDATGAVEISMTALGSKEHWSQTGRWDTMDNLFKVEGASGKWYALNGTHEEIVTPLMGEFIRSYRDLDSCAVYQIQTKFRNEARAKSGILRGREFLMKDLYSFHRDSVSLDAYFEEVRAAYVRIYDRLGIGAHTHYVFASGGDFSKYSYEFQTELDIGEDDVYVCQKCHQAHNREIVPDSGFACVRCGSAEHDVRSMCEVGNIFQLGTRFSDAFGLSYQDESGASRPVVMGCYGIGVSRVAGVVAERMMDEKGLVWPDSIAPYSHYVIATRDTLDSAFALASKLEAEGAEVIFDDRDASFGTKASDADLLGIPNRVIVSAKTLEAGGYELKRRTEDFARIVSI